MLKLSNGTTYFIDDNGKKVCTGSQNGRPDNIPLPIRSLPSVKLHLERLKMYDGDCYDAGGCYWGSGNGTTYMYCAWGTVINPVSNNPFPPCQIFVRANSRKDAKARVREKLPQAKFFN